MACTGIRSLRNTLTMKWTVLLCVVGLTGAPKIHENCEARRHVEVPAIEDVHHIIHFWFGNVTTDPQLLTISIVRQQTPGYDNLGSAEQNISAAEALEEEEEFVKWELYEKHIRIVTEIKDKKHSATVPTEGPIKLGWNYFKIKAFDLGSLAVFSDGVFRNLVHSDEINKHYHNVSIPRPVEKLRFSGSNITVDCYNRFTQWHVSLAHKQVIPLTRSMTRSTQVIDMFSGSEFLPDLRLSTHELIHQSTGWDEGAVGATGQKIRLGWDKQEKILRANSSVAIPGRRVVTIAIHCSFTDDNYLCHVKHHHVPLLTLKLPEAPQYLLARPGPLTSSYRVRLRSRALPPTGEEQYQLAGAKVSCPPPPPPEGGNGFTSFLVTLLVVSSLLLVLVLVLKLVFGATLVYKPRLKSLAWLVPGSEPSSAQDCEMSTWPREDEREADALLQHADDGVTVEQQQALELWKAVVKPSLSSIHRLVSHGVSPNTHVPGHDTTPLQEAHLRGHEDVLEALGEDDRPADNDVIKSLIPILQWRIEKLMGVAPQKAGEVQEVLSLPGLCENVSDSRGRGLVHHAVSLNTVTGTPRWEPQYLQHLLNRRKVFCNAVDFQGNTPLHCLASYALGRGGDYDVSQRWVQCAEALLKAGADPTLLNAQDFTPLDIAQFNGNEKLVELFARHQPKQQRRSHLFNTAADATIEKCKGLLAASQAGVVATLAQLNNKAVIDPVLAGGCPLAAAVLQRDYEVACLLLSAGASPCAGRGITALQVAHYKQGLPAVFAAIIRINCYNRLNYASARASQDLAWIIKKMAEDILEFGSSREADATHQTLVDTVGDGDQQRKLRVAMNTVTNFTLLELTFPCQLYCQENMISHAVANLPNPVEQAIIAGKKKSVITLCKDTLFTPYPNMLCGEEPTELADSLLLNDIKLLENFLTARADSDSILFNFCNEVKISGKTSKSPPLSVWITIAKLGLQTIFHRLVKNHYLEDNKIVDPNCGFTMLHFAAAYGRVPLIQSLLKMGHDPNLAAAFGATPYHLSVVRHHPEAVTCFQHWATLKGITFDKMLLQLDFSSLKLACSRRAASVDVLPKDDYTKVLCGKNSARKRVALLTKRFDNVKKDNLFDLVKLHDIRLEDNVKFMPTIKQEVKHFLDKLAFNFPAINCTVVEDPVSLNMYSLNLEYEFCIEINQKIFLQNKFVETGNVTAIIKESFQAAVSGVLSSLQNTYSCLDSSTTFTYPYYKFHDAGAVLYMLKYSGNKIYRIKNILILKTDESSTSINHQHSRAIIRRVSFANINFEQTQISQAQKSTLLKICLTLCSGLSDKLCCLHYSNTRLSRENSELTPRLAKINLRLIETILVQVLPNVQFTIPFDADSLHSNEDDTQKNLSKYTDSSTDLLNETTCIEGEETGLQTEDIINNDPVQLSQESSTVLYDRVSLVIDTALDQCGRGTLLTEGMFGTAHPRELDTVKQTFMAVQTFMRKL